MKDEGKKLQNPGAPGVPAGGLAGVRRFLDLLLRFEVAVAVAAVSLSAVALFADLVAREVFKTGLFGSLRVAVFSVAVASLIGFAACVGTNSHMRINLLDRVIPRQIERSFGRLSHAVSAGIAGFLTFYACQFVHESYRVNEIETALGVPLWPVQAVLIWAFASAALRHALYMLWPDLQPESSEVTA